MKPVKTAQKDTGHNLYASARVTDNLICSAELTELCFQLRLAVLRQTLSDQEALRRALAEPRAIKERAWLHKRS